MKLESGQTAVVTGAGSGIGRALAHAFGRRGLNVVALDIEAGPLDTVARELAADGVTALPQRCDVTDPDRFLALRDRVLDRFGRVDVLCNNAGVVGPRRPAWEQRLQDWQWMVDVNLYGVVNGLAAFLPGMVAAGRGHIVNVSSISGLAPIPGGGNAPYAASKYAVVGLTETLALELADRGLDIGVTVVCPGRVATRIREAERNRPAALQDPDYDGRPAQFDGSTPAAAPEEVAAQVLGAIEAGRLFLLPGLDVAADVRARTARLAACLPD
jgi:NAD(P)-dependent dehydrogenase (short-subunit alcohol dehydrogenase family)